MKKKIVALCMAAMAVFMVACGDNSQGNGNVLEEVTEDNSGAQKEEVVPDENAKMGEKYGAAFLNSGTSDYAALAEELASLSYMEGLVTMEVTPGFLNGFDAEISGFDKGMMFSPMIGSIPFVAYVFETADTKALIEELKASANMNWNICTMADELYVTDKDNLVFFIMCSNEQ